MGDGKSSHVALIPKTMGTQHPDHARRPFFAQTPLIDGRLEITEAYESFKTLRINEQMWDSEGKKADRDVVQELFQNDSTFFKGTVLGKDCFLTPRIPNPSIQKKFQRKIVQELLENVPRSYDDAREFYGKDAPPPLFEVILPMTTRYEELARVKEYYEKNVVRKERMQIFDLRLREWMGEILPKTINVIPLIERVPDLIEIEKIILPYINYLKRKRPLPHLRVFLARSDPALNYSYLSALLAIDISLSKIQKLEDETGVKLYPILG